MPIKSVRIDVEPNIINETMTIKKLETILEDERRDDHKCIDILPSKIEEQKSLLTTALSNPLSESGKDENDEGTQFKHAFLLCCWRRPIMKSAQTVCYLSAISFFGNFISLIFAGSQTSMHLAIEICVLIVELICLLLLFYALSHEAARCMKPYLLFGALWNIFLTLLWLFCLAELLKGSYFPFRVSTTLSQAILPSNRYHSRYQKSYEANENLVTTISVFVGLGATIFINFWFLHIIVLAYFYLQKKKQLQRQPFSCPWSPTATISSNNSPISKQLPNGHTVFL